MDRLRHLFSGAVQASSEARNSREEWVAKVAARDQISHEAADELYDRIFAACRNFGQLLPQTAASLMWTGALNTGDTVARRVDILEAALAGEGEAS